MPDQCYFDGNFYQCAADAAPGESPAVAPAKWRRVRLPKHWRWILSRLTYAHLLDLDGQTDKARVKRAEALETDRLGLEYLIRQEANAEEERLGRPNVRTHC